MDDEDEDEDEDAEADEKLMVARCNLANFTREAGEVAGSKLVRTSLTLRHPVKPRKSSRPSEVREKKAVGLSRLPLLWRRTRFVKRTCRRSSKLSINISSARSDCALI